MKFGINSFFKKRSYRSKTFLNTFNCIYLQNKYQSYLTKSVIISKSNDIFANLALEDWFYQHYDFTKQQILLLWRNTNCVVIGRHQNPWLESNLQPNDGIILARRNSGGGAVYHDMDNLNLTFFTSRDFYNRRNNLEIMTKSINKEWGVKCEINSREDIVCDGFKISGTASKLSRKNSYHHCTLLVDANKKCMSAALHNFQKNIITNATRSTPAPILNLRELNVSITVDRLMTVVGLEYLQTKSVIKSQSFDVRSNGFSFVSPEERYFPGLNEKIKNFQSWNWRFGRTPKFKIKSSILISKILNKTRSSTECIEIDVDVDAGIVKNISLDVPSLLIPFFTNGALDKVTLSFLESQYSDDLLLAIRQNVFNFFHNKLNDQRFSCII